MHRKRNREAGFTLVELLVVLVILGLLATIVVINVLPSQRRAMQEKAKADIATLEQAIDTYQLENFTLPRTQDGLDALVRPPADLQQPERYRAGGYVKRLPKDPWGNPYQYRTPGENGRQFDIFSFGSDGKPGGEKDAADIGNWQ